MVLVDTSIWIDFLRGAPTRERTELHRLIAEGDEIALCGVILQEILQGIPSEKEYHKTKTYLVPFPYLTLNEPAVFETAADIYRGCRKKGRTPRKPVDCLIAAVAILNKTPLFHKDRDFDAIAQCHPLRIYRY